MTLPTSLKRNRPGIKASVSRNTLLSIYLIKIYSFLCNIYMNFFFLQTQEFCNWPEVPFEDMDSTLAVQQYIQQLIRKDASNIDTILKLPENQDLAAWKYEQLRQFCMELNGLAVLLQKQCFPSTCSQMTSTEQWIFL